MLIYLIKFSACLTIFMVFYNLFLEKENMHVFKRIYLLSVIILAFSIPLITFITYVDPVYISENIEAATPLTLLNANVEITKPTNYLPLILWTLYTLGVFIFGIKFIRNLALIILKIKRNQKQQQGQFTNVLLNNESVPHTFLNFIFLNKNNFENQLIPTEVILHEQTHAKQKHSIDILFIEFIQVVLWFHPLIYLIKKQIKLNHEFLADQAVINQGISKSNYQNLVLAFSSSAANTPFANAFNYSSIKKRFTIMNTHTSTQKIWLRTLLILPLITMSLYGFSQKKEVVKETKITEQQINSVTTTQQTPLDFVIDLAKQNAKFFYADKEISSDKAIALIKENEDLSINAQKIKTKQILVYITETPIIIPNNGKSDDAIFINGTKIGPTKEITLSKTALSNCKITTKKGAITQFKMKIPEKPTETINGNKLTKKMKKLLESSKSGDLIHFFMIKDSESFMLSPIRITIE